VLCALGVARLIGMQHSKASAVRVKASVVFLTLMVHGLLILLFFQGESVENRTPMWQPPMVDVWIHLPQPPSRIDGDQPAPRRRSEESPLLSVTPSVAITLQQAEVPPSQAAEDSEGTTTVDWYGEASKLAARHAEDSSVPGGMGQPVQKMREACKPRDSSFEWSPEQEEYGLLPLPYMMVGERCVVGIRFFSCSLGAMPEPNKRLFDDMRKGSTPQSSVPSPHTCD
jgi:hypothetical protein